MTDSAAPLETAPPPRRWDPVVKLTHWTIVGAILANGLITEEGSNPHIWVGYALAATLALRLIWGVIGPAEARFAAFPPSPGRALAHLREIAQGAVTREELLDGVVANIAVPPRPSDEAYDLVDLEPVTIGDND